MKSELSTQREVKMHLRVLDNQVYRCLYDEEFDAFAKLNGYVKAGSVSEERAATMEALVEGPLVLVTIQAWKAIASAVGLPRDGNHSPGAVLDSIESMGREIKALSGQLRDKTGECQRATLRACCLSEDVRKHENLRDSLIRELNSQRVTNAELMSVVDVCARLDSLAPVGNDGSAP